MPVGIGFNVVVGNLGLLAFSNVAFFGIGAYAAGILAANGWGEPLTGLLAYFLSTGLVRFPARTQ